jgi:GNAT superfamily N-acetyltransferase
MTIDKQIKISLLIHETDCEPVRQLLRSFVRWHLDRHVEDQNLINQYFDRESFEKELNQLPGKYVYPTGALLLAYYGHEPAGCVALKQIMPHSCEMKRMFVYEKFRGLGVGKRLAAEIIVQARTLGFKNMKLDTSFRQLEAQKLYQSLGFKTCLPYYELTDKLKDWLVFMEIDL